MREQDTLTADDRLDEALQGIQTGQKSTLSGSQYGGKVGFKERSWVSAYAVNHITPPLTITEEKLCLVLFYERQTNCRNLKFYFRNHHGFCFYSKGYLIHGVQKYIYL